jgi:hypothetical protein
MRFVGKEAKVQLNMTTKIPAKVTVGAESFAPLKLVAQFPDAGFGQVPMPSSGWQRRHHRNHYLLETSNGFVLHLYLDHASAKGSTWVLYGIYQPGERLLAQRPPE